MIKKIAGKIMRKTGLRENPIKPPEISNNKSFVHYALFDKIQEVPESQSKDGKNLPSQLIISKGKYMFSNKIYDLDKEGLYRFIHPGVINEQRIVFENNLDSLLSSIAWIHSHGNKDDEENYTDVLKKATSSKIFATCGSVSEWTTRFLKEHGFRVRIVAVLTLDDWNSYDNGHILIEVFKEELKKWVVYDIDNDAYFTKDGNPLSLIEFTKQVRDGKYDINFIAKKNDIDTSNFFDKQNNYDYSFLIEARFLDQDTRRKWYKHVFQVSMIVDGKYSYFFDSTHIKKIQSYSSYHKFLEKDEFMKKFYRDE